MTYVFMVANDFTNNNPFLHTTIFNLIWVKLQYRAFIFNVSYMNCWRVATWGMSDVTKGISQNDTISWFSMKFEAESTSTGSVCVTFWKIGLLRKWSCPPSVATTFKGVYYVFEMHGKVKHKENNMFHI